MSFLDWIHEEYLDVAGLCMNTNPKALKYIKERIDHLDVDHWCELSDRPYAKQFVNENLWRLPKSKLSLVRENLRRKKDPYAKRVKKNDFKTPMSKTMDRMVEIMIEKEGEDGVDMDEVLLYACSKRYSKILKRNLHRIDEEDLLNHILRSNYDWKIRLLMDYEKTEYLVKEYLSPVSDACYDFLFDASTNTEMEFIKRYLNDDNTYYYSISANPNIFQKT